MKIQGVLGEYEVIEANKTQVGGDHYLKYGALQPWDVWLPWNLNGFQAAIIKYVVRYRDKEGLKDLEKARHFLAKLIELETQRYANENSKRGTNRKEGVWSKVDQPSAEDAQRGDPLR